MSRANKGPAFSIVGGDYQSERCQGLGHQRRPHGGWTTVVASPCTVPSRTQPWLKSERPLLKQQTGRY